MASLFDGFEGYRVPADADVDQALASALIAVDANVLLNLYRYNAQTTADLLTILERLGNRLVVPYQAVVEFHRNRLTAMGNPEGPAREIHDALGKNQRSTTEVLARWARQIGLDDTKLAALQADADQTFARLLDEVRKAQPDRVQANTPSADDQVLVRLAALVDGKVLDRPADEDWTKLVEEGLYRVANEVPPGYLDAEKSGYPEGAAGDFLVYRQACEEATKRHLDLVIVTGDEKDDWWWKHRSAFLGPRPEMAEEFHVQSGGQRLFLIRPRDLLLKSAVVDVVVSPTSVADADRQLDETEPGHWTPEAVASLLHLLDREGRPHSEVIRVAASLGGFISRSQVYEICNYDDERMLKGFTRPTARITSRLQLLGMIDGPVEPALKPLYSDDGRARGFRIPIEMTDILSDSQVGQGTDEGSAPGKYEPFTVWLQEQNDDAIPVTFDELEEIIGVPLAPSARNHAPYWYSRSNSLGRAIEAAGFKASRVNLTAETAVLLRREQE